MARKIENPMEAIKADIEQKYNMALKEFAGEMTSLIEASYESVIQQFYDDYEPRWYKRTGYTYYGSDRFDDPFHTSIITGGFESGIHVGPEFYPDDPYRASKDWVFPRTFKEGIHGFFKGEFNEWKSDRDIKLKTEFIMNGKKGDLNKFLNANRKKVKVNKVKHIPRRFYVKSIKAKTPIEAMDKSFKHLTTKKNMDTIFSAILGEYFG
jgi:hypothetical protein